MHARQKTDLYLSVGWGGRGQVRFSTTWALDLFTKPPVSRLSGSLPWAIEMYRVPHVHTITHNTNKGLVCVWEATSK